MSFKFVSHAARLLGFLVSPLLTAPAAAADLERAVPAAVQTGDAPAVLHLAKPARDGATAGVGRRRVGF